jgi:transposase
MHSNYYGIDISKLTFDTVDQEGKHSRYSNDKRGFKEFSKNICKESLCVMESTGIYHLELARFLHTKSVAISVVNPLRIKRFSQMNLQRNKTDKADAKMISLYAQNQEVKLWKPAPKEVEEVKDICQVLEQYIEFRSGLKNKLDALKIKKAPKSLVNSVLDQIETVSVSIEELQKTADDLTASYKPEMLKNILSIKGIGKRTASLIIMASGGFEDFENAKQLSSYFGLAPIETSSGTSINGSGKISKMGNPLVRKKLYMCSLQASRCNTSCKNLYERLLAKGKPKKVALIAVANKLIKQVFAIAKSGLPYDDEYKSTFRSKNIG